jgi:hypothetical protein
MTAGWVLSENKKLPDLAWARPKGDDIRADEKQERSSGFRHIGFATVPEVRVTTWCPGGLDRVASALPSTSEPFEQRSEQRGDPEHSRYGGH